MSSFLLLSPGLALALSLAEPTGLATGEPVRAVTVAQRAEGTRLVVAGDSSTTILDAGGATLGSTEAARALLLRDIDDDGLDDLVLCGDTGVWVSPWSAALPTGATQLDGTPCEALAAYTIGGASGVATASSLALTLWADDGTTLAPGTDAGVSLGGAPRLAASATELAALAAGDDELVVVGERGVSTLAVGGTAVDVASHGGAWWLLLGDGQVLRSLSGGDTALGATPLRLSVTDLDLDGLDDLLVLGDGLLEAWLGDGGYVSVVVPAGASVLATGDVVGDPCPDVLLDDPAGTGLLVVETADCPSSWDRDADGVTLAEGDCDDDDNTVYPGAPDACDGVDNDCDGTADELGLELDYYDSPYEGDTALFWPVVAGCDPGVVLTLDDPSTDIATCTLDGVVATCALLDNGTVLIHAAALDGEGAVVDSVDVELVVANVSPSLTLPAEFAEGLYLDVGEAYTGTVTMSDPGADTLTLTSSGAPDWFQVAPTGSVVATPAESGYWRVSLRVADDDGAATTTHLSLVVRDDDPYDGEPEQRDTAGYAEYGDGCNDDDTSSSSCGSYWGCGRGGGGCCGAAVPLGLLGWALRRRADR